jgi:hypothetical protein
MSKLKYTKENCVLWETATKDIIHEVEDAGLQAVTECWRNGIEGYEADNKADKDQKIIDDNLNRPDISVDKG